MRLPLLFPLVLLSVPLTAQQAAQFDGRPAFAEGRGFRLLPLARR